MASFAFPSSSFRLVVAWLCAAALLLAPSWARAAPIVLGAGGGVRHLGESLEMLVDPEGRLTPEALASPGVEPRFSPAPMHPNVGFSRGVVWLRFTLENAAASEATHVIDTAREWVDEADLYPVSAAGVGPPLRSGATVPIALRPLRTERLVFPVTLPAGGARTFLLRLHGRASIAVDGEILPLDAFLEADARQRLFFGGFFTVLLAMGVYNLLLFARLRDRAPLHLAVFLITLGIAEACVHGYVNRLLPAAASFIHLSGASLAFGAGSLALYAFCEDTLATSIHAPRVHAVMRWSAVGSAAAGAVAAVLPGLHALTYVGEMVLMPAVLVAAAAGARKGDPTARVATFAVAAFLAPMSVTGLTLYALVPLVPWMDQGNHAGAMVMAVLFSLIVAEGIRAARAEATALSAALRRQVEALEARGRDVAQLNDELRRQIAGRSRELAEVLARKEGTFTTSTLAAGSVFDGRYEVVTLLGAGGMGAVYEVERASDRRRLALKLITGVASGASAARFAREAEIGATLRHPNVVQILDVGMSPGGGPFLVMELVAGKSLDQERARYGDVAWALPILRGTAEGLRAIHDHGIVHRDLKPGNVLLAREGEGVRPMIADFGISGFEDAVDPNATTQEAPSHPGGTRVVAPASSSRAQLTGTGAFLGTPSYMPPEAARGRVGPPADVFAFGVMAYHMLSGSHAFEQAPVFLAVSGDPFPVPALIPGLPGRLAELIGACLRERPGDRPAIAEVVAALAEV